MTDAPLSGYRGVEFEGLVGRKLKVRDGNAYRQITVKSACPSLGNAARIVLIDTDDRQHSIVVLDLTSQLEGTRDDYTDRDIDEFEKLVQAMEVRMAPSSFGQAKRWAKNPVAKLKDLNAYIQKNVRADGDEN